MPPSAAIWRRLWMATSRRLPWSCLAANGERTAAGLWRKWRWSKPSCSSLSSACCCCRRARFFSVRRPCSQSRKTTIRLDKESEVVVADVVAQFEVTGDFNNASFALGVYDVSLLSNRNAATGQQSNGLSGCTANDFFRTAAAVCYCHRWNMSPVTCLTAAIFSLFSFLSSRASWFWPFDFFKRIWVCGTLYLPVLFLNTFGASHWYVCITFFWSMITPRTKSQQSCIPPLQVPDSTSLLLQSTRDFARFARIIMRLSLSDRYIILTSVNISAHIWGLQNFPRLRACASADMTVVLSIHDLHLHPSITPVLQVTCVYNRRVGRRRCTW